MEYRHTDDMGEISGFGGGYEAVCQNMLHAACKWLLEDKPAADPQFHGFKDVYGLVIGDNADAKEFDKVVLDAANGDCTGAMHQAVVSRALWIKKNGWDAYCTELRNREAS